MIDVIAPAKDWDPTYSDGKETWVRDFVNPRKMTHVLLTNGNSHLFSGSVRIGEDGAVYAFRGMHTDCDGITTPKMPLYIVDGLDEKRRPVYVAVAGSSEREMFLDMGRNGLFDNGPVSYNHRVVNLRQLRKILPVNALAPVFDGYPSQSIFSYGKEKVFSWISGMIGSLYK